jgi:hypothetical protein
MDLILWLQTWEPFHTGIVGQEDKHLIWDPVICKKWLSHCHDFLKLLSALFKVTHGQAPYNLETQLTQIHNNLWHQCSLVAFPDHLVWILEYNKTCTITSHNEYFMCVLPNKVVELTMLWVQLDVPVYKAVIHALYGHELAPSCHYLLFAGPGSQWKQAVFSEYFQKISEKFFHVKIGTTMWRQMAVTIHQHHISSPRLLAILNALGEENFLAYEDDIGACQAGNGVPTEQWHYVTLHQMLQSTLNEVFSLFIEIHNRFPCHWCQNYCCLHHHFTVV